MITTSPASVLHLFKGTLKIESQWHEPRGDFPRACQRASLVLLHEGLGCIAMWKQFPQALADATGSRVFAYSRQGYGASSPIAGARPIDFMQDEAQRVLPAVLDAVGIESPILIGHSDGASIALLAAALVPNIRAITVMAPHLFVEKISIDSIEKAHEFYEMKASGMREKLANYHSDVDGAFYGWANIWLKPEFGDWSITDQVKKIKCPVLAIQGEQDQYGSMAQLDSLKSLVPQSELTKLNDCRHSPQFDQPEAVISAIARFVSTIAK